MEGHFEPPAGVPVFQAFQQERQELVQMYSQPPQQLQQWPWESGTSE